MSKVKVLSIRSFDLIKNNLRRLIFLVIQAPILMLFLYLAAGKNAFTDYVQTRTLLFSLACASIWIGLFNSIQEICKERSVVKRDFQSNMYYGFKYIKSKIYVFSIICLVQSFLMIICFIITIGKPKSGILVGNSFFELFVTTFLINVCATSLGLFVSSVSKKAEVAMLFAPILLITQLLFSGILFNLSGSINKVVSSLTISKWAIESYGSIANLNSLNKTIPLQDAYISTSKHLFSTWIILLLMSMLFFVLSTLGVRNIVNDEN